MNVPRPSILIILSVLLFTVLTCYCAYADTDDSIEQREFTRQDNEEPESFQKIESADSIFEKIKQRAELKIKEHKKELLRKFDINGGISTGHETNPLQQNLDSDDDYFLEETLQLSWLPTFSKKMAADISYYLYNVNYMDNTDINFISNTLRASLKFYPQKRMRLESGVKLNSTLFPTNKTADYLKISPFLKFNYIIDKKWNYGGSYEYSAKEYNSRLARDSSEADISGLARQDEQHSVNLFVTRYLKNFSVRLRARASRNDSNDRFQDYYDYNSYRSYFTIAQSFMDKKLYLSFTPNFERRNYDKRLAVTTARYDNILQYDFGAYYSINNNLRINYNLTNRMSSSNSSLGEFNDITNSIGMSFQF